jgi:hypothetical protein
MKKISKEIGFRFQVSRVRKALAETYDEYE